MSEYVMVDVDALAQIIREVDGNHSLGAGALAEAIVGKLAPTAPAGDPVLWATRIVGRSDLGLFVADDEQHARNRVARWSEGEDPMQGEVVPLYTAPQPAATAPREPAPAVGGDNWVDVSERKPGEAQEVLFVLEGKTVAGAWIGDIFWYSNKPRAALWWQPFPKPRLSAETQAPPAPPVDAALIPDLAEIAQLLDRANVATTSVMDATGFSGGLSFIEDAQRVVAAIQARRQQGES